MSTLITINAGGDALLDRNKQQTQANRFAKLERDNANKVEQQGQQQRDERLAADGRNPDGSLKAGSHAKTQRKGPEPAANRFGGSTYLGPAFAPHITGNLYYSNSPQIKEEQWYQFKTSKASSRSELILPTRLYGVYGQYDDDDYVKTGSNYLPTGGPSGSPAIEIWSQAINAVLNFSEGGGEQGQSDPSSVQDAWISGDRITSEVYLQITNPEIEIFPGLLGLNLSFQPSESLGRVSYQSMEGNPVQATFAINWPVDEWMHVAATCSVNTISIYLAGSLAYSYQSAFTGCSCFSSWMGFNYPIIPDGIDSMYIHGLRSVKKVLYTGNFTPPSSIRY